MFERLFRQIQNRKAWKYLAGVMCTLLLVMSVTGCGTRKMAGIDPVAGGTTSVTVTTTEQPQRNIEPELATEEPGITENLAEDSKNQETVSTEAIEDTDTMSSSSDEISKEDEISEEKEKPEEKEISIEPLPELDENGSYTSKEDVALYLHIYGRLPQNYITKKEAEKLGWSGGSLEPYAPGKCIGGSYFGNYEGNLPEAAGREYHECDIDTLGKKSRGAKRIVYSNDGLIYYTDDHYETFTLLYGEE